MPVARISLTQLNNIAAVFRVSVQRRYSEGPAIQFQFVRSSHTSEVSIGDRHGKCVII
jgi:hypothetical protein